MANVTKMDVINSIQVLYKKGWSQRRNWPDLLAEKAWSLASTLEFKHPCRGSQTTYLRLEDFDLMRQFSGFFIMVTPAFSFKITKVFTGILQCPV